MDKYEFNIKVEQIKKLVAKSDYETAMKIADTVDWRRVRNTNLLSMIASVYEKNEEYQVAKDILLMAFERAPLGKRLLYKLSELALKEGNVEEAEAYYREFCDLAPDDPRQNLLRYMLLKAKGAPVAQLIHSLETYTEEELDEKWLYELAELYHHAGLGAQCVQLCDRIMLMFGLGKYVEKAMELKVHYAPLTNYQMDLVENRDKYEEKLRAVEQQFDGNMRVIPGRGNGYSQEDPGPYPYQSVDGGAAEPYPYQSMEREASGPYAHQGMDGGAAGSYMRQGMDGGESGSYTRQGMDGGAAGSYTRQGLYDGASGPYMHQGADGDTIVPYPNQSEYGKETDSLYTESRIPYQQADQPQYYGAADQNASSYVPYGMEDGVDQVMEEDQFYDTRRNMPDSRPYAQAADDPFNTRLQNLSDDELAVNLREAEVEANLAREMSRITIPSEAAEPPMMERTRVIDNIRSMKSVLDIPSPAREDLYDMPSEPMIEEDGDQGYSSGRQADTAYDYRELGYREHAGTSRTAAYAEASASSEHPSPRRMSAAPELDEEDESPISAVRNHLMIESRTPEKGLTLAVKALKQIHQELGIKNMVIKIQGDRLSKRGVMASADRLAGKDLIVENAGDLTETALDELSDLMEMDESGLIVVLIDNPRQMEALHRKHPILARKFECIGTQEDQDDELAGVDVETVEKAICEQTKLQADDIDMEEETDASPASRPVNKVSNPSVKVLKSRDYSSESEDEDYDEEIAGEPYDYDSDDELEEDRGTEGISDQEQEFDEDIEEPSARSSAAVRKHVPEDDPEEMSESGQMAAPGRAFDGEAEDTGEAGDAMRTAAKKHAPKRNHVEMSEESSAARKLAGKEDRAVRHKDMDLESDPADESAAMTESPAVSKTMALAAAKRKALRAKAGVQNSVSGEGITTGRPAASAGNVPAARRRAQEDEDFDLIDSAADAERHEDEASYGYEEDSAIPYQDDERYDDGEEMGIDEFAQYACKYASDIDCSVTGKSMLALYERIEIMEEDGIPLTRTNAEDLIEEAADKAEKPSLGKLLKGVFSSKYDKDGLLILKEEHFID